MSTAQLTRPRSRLGALRILASAAAIAGLVVGLSGCSPIGGAAVGRQETPTTNLANQRAVAESFCAHYRHPDLTAMRFTREGGRPAPGAGWRVNVVVTVASDEYNEILDRDGWIGDPLPKGPTEASGRSVLVTYSDQSTEVLG